MAAASMRSAVSPCSARGLSLHCVRESRGGGVTCVAVRRQDTTRKEFGVVTETAISFRRSNVELSVHPGRGGSLRASALPDASVLAALATCAAAGKLCEEHTRLGSAVSAPLVAMGAAMVLATTGFLPAESGAYDLVWDHLMPLAVALSLLGCPIDATSVSRGRDVLVAFVIGALGTVVGTLVAYKFVGHLLGPHAWKVAACLCASYVGGSLNYAGTAQALGLGVTPGGQAALASGMAADNLAMAAFLAALALVKAEKPDTSAAQPFPKPPKTSAESSSHAPTTATLACTFACALLTVETGRVVANFIGFPEMQMAVTGVAAASVACTTAALSKRNETNRYMTGVGFPPFPFAGSTRFGSVLMLLFFATLGARADPTVAFRNGAPTFAFIAVQLSVHFFFIFFIGGKLFGKILRLPPWATLTASNACVGGAATAAAAACARGWPTAVQPAVLAGTVGYVVGTPLACAVAAVLRGMTTT